MHTQILACWHCNKKTNNSSCFLRCKEQNFTKVKLEIPLRQAEPLHSMYPVLELPLILRVCMCVYFDIAFKVDCFMVHQINNNGDVEIITARVLLWVLW